MAADTPGSEAIQSYGEYYLTRRIARGGMAELFRARRRSSVEGFEKVLAIKKILPHLSSDGDFITMFINEARIAAQLTHENIVQIFDFGKFEESYYLAMEYVWGKSVQAIQAGGDQESLPINLALYAISRAGMGLDYAHRKKNGDETLQIIHRDISPQNILISYEGEVKLVDFGIAKAAVQSSETKSGVLKGKIPYMSPEQVTGGQVDHRTDIFSLGVVLYELLTGRRLFDGSSEFEMIEKVRSCDIPPPSHHVPAIPKRVESIVLKSLEMEPEKRYQRAEDLHVDLMRYLDDERTYLGPSDLRNFMRDRFQEDIRRDETEFQREAGLVRHHEKNRLRREIQTDIPERPSVSKLFEHLSPTLRRNLYRTIGLVVAALAVYGLVGITGFHGLSSQKDSEVRDNAGVTATADEKRSRLQSTIDEGAMLLTEGDYEGAIARFNQVHLADTTFACQYNRLFSQAFLSRGRESSKESAAAGLEDFRQACEMDPENVEIHFEMGRLLTTMKRYREARLSYHKAIEISPDFPDAHFNLGYLYFAKKAYLLAAEEFETVVRLKPQYLKDAYFNLGLSYYNMGEKGKALEAFVQALSLDPTNKTTADLVRQLKQSGGS